jgi:serine/threonine-protein kinase
MSSLTIGKYRLIAEIGRGGMAEVFLAAATNAGMAFSKLVVVKKLREHLASEPDFMTMLIDEARIAARLNHPNLVQTLEVDEADGAYFLTMEYLDGQPLHRILNRARADVSQNLHLTVLCDVLAGIDYAHDLKDYDGTPLQIVHRDVTPHNCFVTYEGLAKVVDFGIAKAVGRSSETRHGVVKGKTAYMAPEQACGQQVDRRVDVFAVGVMLYEAATRQRMWKGVSETDIVKRLVTGQIPSSPKALDPTVDDELDRICQKALMLLPAMRYQTARELQHDLEAYLAPRGGRTPPRELGRFVAQVFADKRAATDKVIESQLAKIRTDSRSNLLVVPPSSASRSAVSSSSVSGAASISTGPSSGGVGLSTPGAVSATPAGHSVTNHQGSAPNRQPVSLPAEAINALSLPGVKPLLLFAAALMSATAIAVVMSFPGGSAKGGAPPGSTSVSQPITITLRATPLEAKFRIDDGPWEDNPYIGSFPRDEKPHVIRAKAEGYSPKEETVTFKDDVSIRISLSKK